MATRKSVPAGLVALNAHSATSAIPIDVPRPPSSPARIVEARDALPTFTTVVARTPVRDDTLAIAEPKTKPITAPKTKATATPNQPPLKSQKKPTPGTPPVVTATE